MKKPEWLRVGSDNFEFCSLDPIYSPLGDIARIYSYEAFEITERGKRSLGVFRSLRAAQAAVESRAAKARVCVAPGASDLGNFAPAEA